MCTLLCLLLLLWSFMDALVSSSVQSLDLEYPILLVNSKLVLHP